MLPPGSDPPDPAGPEGDDSKGPDPDRPGPDPSGSDRRGPRRRVTPASRLLFWIRAAFVGDAALAAFGGVLLAVGREEAAAGVVVFTAVRAALGVATLLIALRALEHRHPNDDGPSAVG